MRLLVPILVLLIGGQVHQLFHGKYGIYQHQQLVEQVARQEAGNQSLRDKNDLIRAEILDLRRGGAAVEERARNELGMIREGETFYRIIPQ